MIDSPTDTFGENPSDWTKLLPELKPYYQKRAGHLGWPMLRSPLVYQIPFFSWKLANNSYTHKARLVAQYEAEGKWESALWIYERPYRLHIVHEWMLAGIDVSEFFPAAWIDTELPDSELAKPMYAKMFRELGFLTDVEGLKFEDLPDELLLYRGAKQKWRKGLAWTRNVETAIFFANRSEGAKVWYTTVPKRAIFAWFQGRGEEEVVVNPRMIKEVFEYNS